MDAHEVEAVAAQVAEKVVSRLFLVVGVDVNKKEDLIKLQRDLIHLREWRESIELIKTKGLAAAVGFIVTGFLAYVVLLFTRH